MSEFYTWFALKNNTFYVSGYRDGKRFNETETLSRFNLYTESTNGSIEASQYKTLDGKPLYQLDFNSAYEMKSFVKDNSSFMKFYGMARYEYDLIHRRYPGAYGIENYDLKLIKPFFFDIETDSVGGYAKPENPWQPVTLITVFYNGKFYAIGKNPYTPKADNVKYLHCADEKDLLMSFFKLLRKIDPAIISGWNIEGYDIPYLINRCKRIFETDAIGKKFSPFEIVNSRLKKTKFGEMEIFDIYGVTIFDYLPLYKKFQLTKLADYKLETVSMYELGEGKVNFDDEGNLRTLAQDNWEKFVDYGIRDSELPYLIDKNRNYIALAVQIAMRSKCNYSDVFFQTRLWEQIIFTYLEGEMGVYPHMKSAYGRDSDSDDGYEGAFVKEPQVGMHDWLVYYDFTSLYPMTMISYNISPETFVGVKPDISVKDILDVNLDKIDPEQLKKDNVCLAANGAMFRTDIEGFIPKILKKMFEERKQAKDTMLKYEKAADDIKAELEKRGIKV